MWYLFTLIMVSSYTANLAASLTAENLNTPISEVGHLTLVESRKLQKNNSGGGPGKPGGDQVRLHGRRVHLQLLQGEFTNLVE